MSRSSARFWALLLLLHVCFASAYRENGGSFNVAKDHIVVRQLLPTPSTDTDTSSTTSEPPTTTTTTTPPVTDPPTTTTTTSTPPPDTDTDTTTTTPTTTPPTTTPPTTAPPTTAPPTTETLQTSETTVETTDAAGSTIFRTTVVTNTPTDTSPSSTPTGNSRNSEPSSGVSTSMIIGLSVAGGIALIGVIAFFVWKFTRKRPADYDDEPIKWPELNSHADDRNYAPPLNRGASANAGTALDSTSEVDLPVHSASSQYSHSLAADSSANLYAPGADPYAVPPMPGLNPNQPYRDDPSGYNPAGYYDPYRGPVPQVFNDSASVDSHAHSPGGYPGDAIPMSTLAAHQGVVAPVAGRLSPGPQMAYDMDRVGTPLAGRQSPGPTAAYGAPYGGRVSPGPAQAYGGQGMGYGGRHSPGPGPAYGGSF